MEFLLVSDIHADEYNKFAKYSKQGTNSRLDWIVDIFDQILKYGEENGVKTLLIGGDVFDKRGSISVPAYVAVYEKLQLLQDNDWDVLTIVGNHDQALRSGTVHALKPLPAAVIDDHALVDFAGMSLGCVSFCETPSDFLSKLKEVADKGVDAYLIHQGVNGAKIAGDEILSRDETSLQQIREIVGDAWVFSGHYHIHQFVDERFCFIGSSTPKDFGDTTPKGFLHFKDGEITQIESRAPKFVVVESKDLKKKKSSLQGNYVQIRYDKTAPDEQDLEGVEGFIAVQDKVNRKYIKRSEINPEDSPTTIIKSYVDDMVEKEILDAEITSKDVLGYLKNVTGEQTIDQKFSGHSIELQQIVVENFMSYRTATIDFRDLSGLVEIEGENQDDPSASSNGSGKSLIPESLKWGLFGSTARGVTGDSVVNKDVGKNCRVEITLLVDGLETIVTRYRKHKDHKNQMFLTQDGADLRGANDSETQAKLCYVLGTDERTFDNTVFFGHNFTQSFAALPDKGQKAVLENILGVEYFSELFEKAKELRKQAELKRDADNATIESLTNRIEYANQTLEDLQKSYERFESEKLEQIRDLRAEVERDQDYLEMVQVAKTDIKDTSKLEKDLAAITQRLLEFESVYESLQEAKEIRDDLSRKKQKTLKKQSDTKYEIDRCIHQAEKTQEDADQLTKGLQSKECPTCHQKLAGDVSLFEEKISDLQNKIEGLVSKAEESQEIYDRLVHELGELDTDLSEITKVIDEFTDELQDKNELQSRKFEIENKISHEKESKKRIEFERENIQKRINSTETQIKKLKEQPNPVVSQISKTEKDVKAHQEDLDKLLIKKSALEKDCSLANFWETAFSDQGTPKQSPIKSYLFDSVVPTLDELSRVYSEELTSGSIEVRFNTVKYLKTGAARDRFSVDVVNAYGAETYAGDSGGERRKVDLIVMFTLYSLARLRSGSRFDVAFLDEILDSLDVEGCDRVMNLLNQMVSEIPNIFVITHNENLKNRFSTRLKVIKKDGISKIA